MTGQADCWNYSMDCSNYVKDSFVPLSSGASEGLGRLPPARIVFPPQLNSIRGV